VGEQAHVSADQSVLASLPLEHVVPGVRTYGGLDSGQTGTSFSHPGACALDEPAMQQTKPGAAQVGPVSALTPVSVAGTPVSAGGVLPPPHPSRAETKSTESIVRLIIGHAL
jgi:hypothetical protein